MNGPELQPGPIGVGRWRLTVALAQVGGEAAGPSAAMAQPKLAVNEDQIGRLLDTTEKEQSDALEAEQRQQRGSWNGSGATRGAGRGAGRRPRARSRLD